MVFVPDEMTVKNVLYLSDSRVKKYNLNKSSRMKVIKNISLPVVLLLLASFVKPAEREIYQLRIYTLESTEQESRMDNYLESAYLPALHRAGIEKVGVFKTIDGRNMENNLLMVFIPFKSIQQFEGIHDVLDSDRSYKEAAKDFLESPHNDPPYVRMESILMKAFSSTPAFMVPELNTEKPERVYELRSYQSATEELYRRKVEMFDKGESELFIKLGFEPMFFGEVISGGDMPNLMYMTCHANESSQTQNWKSFVNHPEWNEMKVLERYKNTVSRNDKYMLYPKEYSDL
jgi:hypothetical protein